MLSEQIAALKRYDSATIFNAVALKLGLPNLDYTDHTIRCLMPDMGLVAGFAVTAEVTTNDEDSTALEWIDYYDYLGSQQGPLIAVFQDMDTNAGRGACFGDGMARVHKRLGVIGVIAEGTVRDLVGIRHVGLPVWAWGTVPGHGVFNMNRFGAPVTAGRLRIHSGDLLLADSDGVVRIPTDQVDDVLELAEEVRTREAGLFDFYESETFSLQEMRARQQQY
ncbi:MAG: RraA family protein [Caldilineaceae bacterium SB0661_bin_32]|uniref:Putative 4-hydroxy-4-methyl-2-oxoglutarate aldolase n=1 Tax=Caldilineaceae bacterium SB0661_bin_32 TaxID=2605255 RepID=A0A6B1D374_9CHLR|nr:RraA family protein [Caldilineaceae bacterium SB0661_bin_32]